LICFTKFEPRGVFSYHLFGSKYRKITTAEEVLNHRAVVVKSRRGTVRTRAKISDRVPPGTIFLAFHWREAPANMLTQDFALDPVAKIPEYKICAVRIENPRAKRNAAK
jgi:predicted molibdopterin-dependent oxidoreductase YjgC